MKIKKRTYKLLIFGVLLLGAFIFSLYGVNKTISGNAILQIKSDKGNSLSEGILRLSLAQGELIPASSKLVIENNGEEYTYDLKDLISKETLIGDYYSEGSSLSGNGEGYGVPGIKKEYPKVFFTLKVFEKNSGGNEGDKKSSGNVNEVPGEKEANEESGEVLSGEISETSTDSSTDNELIPPSEISEKENTEVSISSDQTTNEENLVPEKLSDSEPVSETETSANSGEEFTSTTEVILENSEVKKEEEISIDMPTQSETSEISSESSSDESSSAPVQESSPEPASDSTASEPSSEDSSASITGEVISGLLRATSNFFLRLTGTGMAVSNPISEISGEVSFNVPFEYDIEENKKVELVSGSVKTDAEQLSDNEINLKINGNILTITTDYTKKETGFGEEYFGEDSETIEINIREIVGKFTNENFNVKIIYGEDEIISLENEIKNKKIIEEENITEEIEPEVVEESQDIILTETEKEILIKKFGENISIKATNAELIDNRIIIRYELGDYWYEPSYDSEISEDKLEELMNNDRIYWLRDIAKKLSEEEIKSEELSKYIGNYSI